MARKSKIEWTDSTWNPVTGCSKISPGCKHCYAERISKRLQAMGHYSGGWPSAVVKAYRNRLNYIRQAQDERDLLRVEVVTDGEASRQSAAPVLYAPE